MEPSDIDYKGFNDLTKEVEKYREARIVDVAEFNKLSKESGTIILDTRSKEAYEMRHVKGAVHLNFSDFSEGKLAKVIPSKETKILIYCNNNFIGDPAAFARKAAPLALNIPTFINLYGYGYKNVYELGNLLAVDQAGLEFVGTAASLKLGILTKQ